MTLYPTVEEIVVLHETLIAQFGGQPGIRDQGLLESAIARARSSFYETLSEQAAALAQSLVLNHAFFDGNKRVGLAAMIIFLRMNGLHLHPSARDAEYFILQLVIERENSIADLVAWIEAQLKRR